MKDDQASLDSAAALQPESFPETINLADIPRLLQQEEQRHIYESRRTLFFFQTKHTSRDALKIERELSGHADNLLRLKGALKGKPPLAVSEINDINRKTETLIEAFRSLAKEVREDRRFLVIKEGGEKFNLLNFFIGTFVGPFGVYSFLKLFFPTNDSPANETICRNAATVASIGGGIYTLRYQLKKLPSIIRKTPCGVKTAWNMAVRDIRPKDIKDCLPVYYAKGILKENAQRGKMFLRNLQVKAMTR